MLTAVYSTQQLLSRHKLVILVLYDGVNKISLDMLGLLLHCLLQLPAFIVESGKHTYFPTCHFVC